MDDQKTLPEPLITISPERLSGAPEFTLTRVPLKNLFDYLTEGSPLDEFLQHFPGVTLEHAVAVLDLAQDTLVASLQTAQKADAAE